MSSSDVAFPPQCHGLAVYCLGKATEQSLVTYAEVQQDLGVSRTRLTQMMDTLTQFVLESSDPQLPMLTALIVSAKHGIPSSGYWKYRTTIVDGVPLNDDEGTDAEQLAQARHKQWSHDLLELFAFANGIKYMRSRMLPFLSRANNIAEVCLQDAHELLTYKRDLRFAHENPFVPAWSTSHR